MQLPVFAHSEQWFMNTQTRTREERFAISLALEPYGPVSHGSES